MYKVEKSTNRACFVPFGTIQCPKSNPNFRDITWNEVENGILHEIFRVVSRFPRYISCYIAENRFPLGQFSKSALGALIDNYSFYCIMRKIDWFSQTPLTILLWLVNCVTVHLWSTVLPSTCDWSTVLPSTCDWSTVFPASCDWLHGPRQASGCFFPWDRHRSKQEIIKSVNILTFFIMQKKT